jgi:hypothetical protein
MTRLTTLSKPSNKKQKKPGFKGGLNKLEKTRNDIAVSEKHKTGDRKVSKIGRTKKSPPTVGIKQKNVILSDPVLTKELSDTEESTELSESDNTRDVDDMVKFCKRMCKKTIELNTEKDVSEELIKKKELKRFLKVREMFVDNILKDFRDRVKANAKEGKFILYQYETNTLYNPIPDSENSDNSYLVSELLNKSDTTDTYNTGLKLIADKVSPFRIFHYNPTAKETRVIEVTWATPSKKNTKLMPNKLPDKYNRKLKIAPFSPPILQASTITPEPPLDKKLKNQSEDESS